MDHRAPEVATSAVDDAIATGLGAWIVVAVFSDGWAHQNVPQLEGFFTPWHLALYSGLAASVGWLGWLSRRASGSDLVGRIPRAYRPAALGAAVFAVAGLLDMVWHLTLGVEVGVDALLSPPHLLLAAGGLLLLSGPVRSRWTRGDLGSPLALTAWVLPVALVAFFLLYVSEFAAAAPTVDYLRLPEGDPGHEQGELPALAGLGAFLVTTVLLTVPTVLVWRRGVRPRGLVTTVVAVVATLSVAAAGTSAIALSGVLGAVAGAAAADLAVARILSPAPAGRRLAAAAGTTAVLVWSGHLAALAAVADGLAWPAELWSGVVLVSAAVAAALGWLAAPAPASTTTAATSTRDEPAPTQV